MPFDPNPGSGEHYDTMLAPDLSHVSKPAAATSSLRGRIPLYRAHMWTCAQGMRIPADRPLPVLQGYSHKAAPQKDAVPVPEPSYPEPWEGIGGKARPELGDLLSMEVKAMPRRRIMAAMAVSHHRALLAAGQSSAGRRMRDPAPGDLVTEAGQPDFGRGFGILLAARRERLGDGRPGEVRYIQYGPEESDVERWTGGQFITVSAGVWPQSVSSEEDRQS